MTQTDRRSFIKHAAAGAGAVSLIGLVPKAALGSTTALPAEPIGIGLIGAGRQGKAILAELAKLDGLARVAAVCDTDPSRLRAGLRRVRGAQGEADHRALLDRADVGAVVVATPTHLHKEVALDAMAAGKHVYIEAPLAHTIDDAGAIARAGRDAAGVVQAGLVGRANPVYQLARSFFRSDSVRDLVSLRAQHHRKTSWRIPAPDPSLERARNWRLDPAVSTGLAGEWATHQLDVAHWYLGRYPTSVRGWGDVRLHDDGRTIADTIACQFRFADGAVLDYSATLGSSYGGRHEVFFGSNAAIKLAWSHGWLFKEADAPTQGWEVYANRQQFHNDEGITLIANATQLADQGKLKDGVGLPYSSLYYGLERFLTSVLDGAEVVCSADEGLRATAVGILANEAVTTNTQIAIDPAILQGG